MNKKDRENATNIAESIVQVAVEGYEHAIDYYQSTHFKPTEQIGAKIKNSISRFERDLGVVFQKDYKKIVDELIEKLKTKRSLNA